MRLLVCGGRSFDDFDLLNDTLIALEIDHKIEVVIHGGYQGADTLAGQWANFNHIPVEIYRADWKTYKKAAGPLRNQRMIDEGQPNLVVAFPGGSGTADMVRRAKGAGIKIIEVEP